MASEKARVKGVTLATALAAIVAVVVARASCGGGAPRTSAIPPARDAAAASAAAPNVSIAPAPPAASTVRTTPAPEAAPAARVLFTARWGSGPRDVGRKRPQEGNPEGPMSLAAAPNGDLLVVDQVNGRIARFDARGEPRGSVAIRESVQDVAVARDGTIAALDRLSGRDVALYAEDGRAKGALPLVGDGIPEGGGVTGVFVDDGQVYAEREHGPLVLLGDARGEPAAARAVLPGRPSRDGSSFVTALVDHGEVVLAATTRGAGDRRYARALAVPAPARTLLLLDTDRAGTVYVAGVSGEDDEWLACAALDDGRLLGVVAVAPSTLAEETFREFAVLDGGGVVHAELSEDGVAYVRYDCR